MGIAGDRIRRLRLRAGLTLEEVARHLGIGKQDIYKYEKGTVTNIPLENLEKMAAMFGTTPEYLSGWSDDEKHLEMDLQLVADRNLSYEEQNLITVYRSLSAEGQRYMIQQAHIASQMFGEKNSAAPDEHIG